MYNILICDDQPDIVNALKIYLTPEGYRLLEKTTTKLRPFPPFYGRKGAMIYD